MPMPGAAVFEVNIRTKTYASAGGVVRQVLRDIAFTAQPGEVLALVGRSGIGKSTILRIALGLDRAFKGTAVLPPGRTGVMFQEPRLLPWMTVGDNLRLVRPAHAPPPDIAGLLNEAMLPDVANLLPSELSLGMARRVALARAMAVDPDTLVLDEPFASLDRSLAAALATRIAARAARRRMTVLLSTHDIDQALAMASRILVLAGQPATLAADLPVPPGTDAASVARLRTDLLSRFSFLGVQNDDTLAEA
jgi:ABC-type nitrate/sulfonate/bicarbonate transport system ATPase subunit